MTLNRLSLALLSSLALTAGCFASGDKEGDETGSSADGTDGTSDGADGTADGTDGTADGTDGTADGTDGTDGTEPDVEECTDGVDNDGDGDGDCADEECDGHTACDCVETAWAGSGELGTGDTTAASDDWAPGEEGSCGSSGGLDQTVAWSAPAPGCYQVDTFGTEWDTVLRVVDACGGSELACSDDDEDDEGTYTSQSKVVVGATAVGDAFLFVIDGYGSSDMGAYVLNATEVDGPTPAVSNDLGDSVGAGVASGDSSTSTSTTTSDCGSSPGAAVGWTWTAPSTGTYTFDTYGSSFDTILSLVDEAGCGELACDDDGELETVNESELIAEVEEGVTYHLILSGYAGESGTYTLNITEGDASDGRE